jgi:signal transduction histidine kinase/CheY-like chemotaxis protein
MSPPALHTIEVLAGDRVRFTRISCAMGALMVMAFGMLDWLVDAAPLTVLLAMRMGITSTLLFAFWASFRPWFDRHYLPLMCLIYAVTSVGILAMPLVSSANRLVTQHYYVGALLCLGAMMTLTLLSARVVLGLTGFIAAAHLAGALAVLDLPQDRAILACQLFFLLSSACIGFIGVWFRNDMLTGKLELARKLEEQVAIAERASREKSRFMAAASHDLRQPLQAISLFGAVLEKELQGNEQHPMAQRLMQAVGALQVSLESMLDISRLDAGVVSTDLRPVELNAVQRELNHVFSTQAEDKGLQLRLRASPLWVHSDARLLARMLANLVDNAIKYTPQGGIIVACRRRGDRVWVDICDTGIGIAPDQRSAVFEEFYQINNPGRDRSKGLGLGLTIVKRLSLLLDHPVHVLPGPGRGTRFRVVLRAAPAPLHPPHRYGFIAADPRNWPLPSLPERALLLDDEDEIRVAVAALLCSFGIDVVCVEDSERAEIEIRTAREQLRPFNVFLCDYRLSQGADGLDVAQRIASRPDLNLPVILVTGETAPDRLRRAYASGIRVLFKPVAAQDLLRALTDATEPSLSYRA